jgi:hypothetical protein
MKSTQASKTVRRRRPQPTRTITAWMLIGGFLLQPVLAYLVTPFVDDDGKGHRIVVCTLKGQKLVDVDLPQIADNQDAEHCSALELFQMASTARVATAPVAPSISLYAVDWLDQTAGHQHRSLHFSAYSTRAPPVA